MSASLETLMRQAGMTADVYLAAAVKYIDSEFGDGYAKKNPELVGQFMQTAALDFHTVLITNTAEAICEAIRSVAHNDDH